MAVMLYTWSSLRLLMAFCSCLERVKHIQVHVSMRVREGFVVLENLY